jgi:hypothetical protein
VKAVITECVIRWLLPYTVLHDESLKSGAWNSQRPMTPCEPGLAMTNPYNSGLVFKLPDDGLFAEFENGGDFGGSEVFGFHAGRLADK